MSVLFTIGAFLIVFSILVLAHEFGHFIVAKRNGIKVEEFGFGLPPRLWGKKKGETLYSINAIPFGGFVRMLGEDPAKGKKNKRSYSNQSKRVQVKVLSAGVAMNFLLAWVLITVGFIVGMEPMLGPDDVFPAVDDGRIILEEVEEAEMVESQNYMPFPRVKVYEVGDVLGGLRQGDVIISVDGQGIYSLSGYKDALEGLSSATYVVYRDGAREEVLLEFPSGGQVIVSDVVDGAPGDLAGLQEGDEILSINGQYMHSPGDVISYIQGHSEEVLAFSVDRKGGKVFYEIKPEDGQVGIYLSALLGPSGPKDVTVYSVDQLTAVVEIKDEQYPFYLAPIHAFSETFRLANLTVVLFGDLVSQVFSTGDVPDHVAGPVGIAQMSGTFAREGFIPLMRFIALLSISLAVLNILPFPALDGGKLLFILLEFIIGRKISPKWENYIHLLGYLLILGLIFAITYNDISRLFF
ncbi:RIP metalloprotease RseP [Candidatus Peregrinibacteria bacterium]|jgi:regulator of sigma E protease|nr:RIP metalloprotease RseP [Candidatus Peregrinibacteria bacterium]MBT4055719.1 RIP metalloprotease RseP [Candidatus Peregrinibacteria bacterium]